MEDGKAKSDKKGISLLDAPRATALRIVDILGGEGLRRRLLALGFHKGDIVELDCQAILRGPVIVCNMTCDTRVALGRGVAQRIRVEIVHDRE